jgi:hypothetical protein
MSDPVEQIIRDALTERDIGFDRHDSVGLDFYIPDWDLHIECKQFHSPRSIEQCAKASNVILIQGKRAAKIFAYLLKGDA